MTLKLKPLLLIAALPFAVLFIAGCENKREQKAGEKEAVKKTAEQKLVTATVSDPKTFNLVVADESSSTTAASDLFEGLLRIDPKTLKPEPMLAKSWETSEDGKSWTFHLRDGLKWSDGAPLTADDVLFTYEVIYHPTVPNSLKDILTVEGEKVLVVKVDEKTVRFGLPRPFAPFLYAFGGVNILPKHILGPALEKGEFAKTWGVDTPPEKLVGNGPYIMTKYEPTQYIKYKRNPHYWMKDEAGKQLPYLTETTILIVPDQNTQYVKFTAGQTDIHSPRPEEVETLKRESKKLGISVREVGLDTGTPFVTFNRNPRHYIKDGKKDPKYGWFRDPYFLKAIAHAIDKETIIANTMHGLGKAAVADISEENKLFHNPNITGYEYDLEKAARLLEEGGYKKGADGRLKDKKGNPVEFDLNTNAGNLLREQICSILQEDWVKLGMKVNFRPLEFNNLVEKLLHNFQWDAILIGLTGGIEPHNGANVHRSSGNLHFWNPRQEKPATDWEAEIDKLIDQGAAEMDTEKRKAFYYRMQEIYHEELPMILTVRQKNFSAYKNSIRNYEPFVYGIYRPERIMIGE